MSRIFKRGDKWYIDYSSNGKRRRKSVSKSKRMAEIALQDAEVKKVKGDFLGYHEDIRITFNKLCDEYLNFSVTNKRPKVHKRDRGLIKNLLNTFNNREIHEITVHDLELYKMYRKNNVSVSTVNRELTCIKHMFNKAVEWGYLKQNHLRTVIRFKEPPGRVRYLTTDEINKLVQQCTNHLKPIVIMALNTGMRKGEILNLVWSDVDMENKVITIKRSKNNESRTLPINDTLFAMLKPMENGNKDQYLFANRNGTAFGEIRRSFSTALRKAGINNFRFHDLRHTFASQLVMSGVDIRTVQELMGHKDIRMTMRYSHLSDAHLKEAVNKIGGDIG